MTDTPHENSHPHGEHPDPDSDATPDQAAAELLAHGLLLHLHDPDSGAHTRHVEDVLDRIARPLPPRRQFIRRTAYAVLASSVFLVMVVIFVSTGTPSSVAAQVERSIAATQQPSTLCYEVLLIVNRESQRPRTGATIYMQAPDTLLVQHNPPGSSAPAFVGRDAQGEWAIDDTGRVNRANPRPFFPPWSVDGQELLVDSVDRILTQLGNDYELQQIDDPEAPNLVCIRGERKAPRRLRPSVVMLWIDPATDLPERIDLAFDTPSRSDARPEDRPNGRPRQRPAPMSNIILQRVPTPPLAADWFSPASHAWN